MSESKTIEWEKEADWAVACGDIEAYFWQPA
jgi:hypothetical protein